MRILISMAASPTKTSTGVQVWGSITDFHNDVDYDWEGCSPKKALSDLKKLKGTKYGKDWDYGGDVGLEGDMLVKDAAGNEKHFFGKNAIAKLIEYLKSIS